MSLLEVGVVGLWLWFGSLIVWMIYTGLPAVLDVLRRPTTPIAQLAPGAVEIEGVIEADSPVFNGRGRACAAVHVSYRGSHWYRHGNKSTLEAEEREGTLVGGGLSVRDRTGVCRLRVTSELIEVSAPAVTSLFTKHEAREFVKASPAYAPILKPDDHVRLIELPIVVGQRVLVSGEAVEDAESSPDGYRQGAGRAFVIQAASERKLLVSAGRQRALLVRAALPLALAVAMVGACAWLTWWAWAIRQGVG